MHSLIIMSDPGGSNPGGLSRSFRGRTRRVPINRPRGYEGAASRVRLSQSSTRIAPGLVGQYHYHRPLFNLILHSLIFPLLGQLHTALPSSSGSLRGRRVPLCTHPSVPA